jgi:hypothetical protein
VHGWRGAPEYSLETGFVTVAPGDPCPSVADAELQVHDCTFLEWQGITCTFDSTSPDQVLVHNDLGSEFSDATTASPDVVDVCYYTGVFYLDPNHPICGRPLLSAGEPVVSPPVAGASAWNDHAALDAPELGAAERREVAGWWLGAARLEHASIASFTRFSLDLMGIGAPPGLLEEAHRAAVDEVRHARLCFALASRYGGAPVGPGPLPRVDAVHASLGDIAEALVREGCVGETLAAVDAAARLALATDPAVRAALEEIVRDESRHAALAWRTLAWIVEQDGSLRERVEAALADERQRWTGAAVAVVEPSIAATGHGLIADSTRRRVFREAWRNVVEPGWASLAAV